MDWELHNTSITNLPAFENEDVHLNSKPNFGYLSVESGSYISDNKSSETIGTGESRVVEQAWNERYIDIRRQRIWWDNWICSQEEKMSNKSKSKDKLSAAKNKDNINTNKSKSSVASTIDSKKDQDWFKIKLSAGYNYKFSVSEAKASS